MSPELVETIWECLAGWTYAKVPDTSKRQTNCCIAVEMILHKALPDAAWSRQTHADLMILDDARPWSPIDAVDHAGIGAPVEAPVPGRWHLVQAWGDPAKLVRGHTFLWHESPASMLSAGFVAEATDARVPWFRASTLAGKANGRKYRLAVLDLG